MKRPAFSTPRALRAPRSSRWVPGNHFELLENGEEFFPRVFQAIADARAQGRKGLVLTCKEALVHYYAKFGFVNEGVSGSTHGGVVWYQMRLKF